MALLSRSRLSLIGRWNEGIWQLEPGYSRYGLPQVLQTSGSPPPMCVQPPSSFFLSGVCGQLTREHGSASSWSRQGSNTNWNDHTYMFCNNYIFLPNCQNRVADLFRGKTISEASSD